MASGEPRPAPRPPRGGRSSARRRTTPSGPLGSVAGDGEPGSRHRRDVASTRRRGPGPTRSPPTRCSPSSSPWSRSCVHAGSPQLRRRRSGPRSDVVDAAPRRRGHVAADVPAAAPDRRARRHHRRPDRLRAARRRRRQLDRRCSSPPTPSAPTRGTATAAGDRRRRRWPSACCSSSASSTTRSRVVDAIAAIVHVRGGVRARRQPAPAPSARRLARRPGRAGRAGAGDPGPRARRRGADPHRPRAARHRRPLRQRDGDPGQRGAPQPDDRAPRPPRACSRTSSAPAARRWTSCARCSACCAATTVPPPGVGAGACRCRRIADLPTLVDAAAGLDGADGRRRAWSTTCPPASACRVYRVVQEGSPTPTATPGPAPASTCG